MTIHDDMYTYMYIFFEMFAKSMKSLWKVKDSFNRTSWKESDVQIVRYTWVLSLSLCLCLCPCFCLCQLGLAEQSPRRDSQALCLTVSGCVLVFLCDLLVSR